jgi:hypothetical protein
MCVGAALAVAPAACRQREPASASISAHAPDSTWYEKSRALDATGDGQPDTLRLRAAGRHGDSLEIALTVVSAGREVLRVEWGSDYMLIDPPFERPATQAVIDSFIRARLDSTLAGASLDAVSDLRLRDRWPPVHTDCEEDPRDCIAYVLREEASAIDWTKVPADSAPAVRARIETAPFDTARALRIMSDIRRNTRHCLTFSYGYESTVSYAWSPGEHRFFLIFSCC